MGRGETGGAYFSNVSKIQFALTSIRDKVFLINSLSIKRGSVFRPARITESNDKY